MSSTSIQSLIQTFFEQHLLIERNASRNTVLAYRDGLRLFLRHASERLGRDVDQLDHGLLDVDVVRSFLDALERDRGCGPRSRNQRLAAIKAFVRYVASVAPEHVERCRRIRELPPARCQHHEVRYLDEDEITQLVKACGSKRDRALILLLYNIGARVQEIVDLDIEDIRLDPIAYVTLVGKGQKQRTCPLWLRTAEAIRAWLAERPTYSNDAPLFLNARGQRLSRSGVTHILRRLVRRAGVVARHAPRISPHVIRHTTAMHLLQAGVDMTTIAAWLGHAQLATTHGYVEVNLRMKQAALAALSPAIPSMPDFRWPRGKLLSWLEQLGSHGGVMRSAARGNPMKSGPKQANSA